MKLDNFITRPFWLLKCCFLKSMSKKQTKKGTSIALASDGLNYETGKGPVGDGGPRKPVTGVQLEREADHPWRGLSTIECKRESSARSLYTLKALF